MTFGWVIFIYKLLHAMIAANSRAEKSSRERAPDNFLIFVDLVTGNIGEETTLEQRGQFICARNKAVTC
jgi:hypothetical protein